MHRLLIGPAGYNFRIVSEFDFDIRGQDAFFGRLAARHEKYEKIALFIQPNIHKNLIATYEKYIKGKKPELYIDENYIKTTKPLSKASDTEPPVQNTMVSCRKSVSLEDIITVCTYIALSKENIEQSIRTYRENRRVSQSAPFSSLWCVPHILSACH